MNGAPRDPEPTRGAQSLSPREALVAVAVAFGVGVLVAGSLPARHAPGGAGWPDTVGTTAGPDAPGPRGAAGPSGSPTAAAGAQVRWRVSSAFGTHLPSLGENAVEVALRLKQASGGRIEWTIDDPDEVVPAFAIVEAVSKGKIPAGYTWLGYEEGRLPASVLFGSVPFGMTPWAYTAWWQSGGGRELAQAIYRAQGVEPILCGLIGPETAGWFREAITTPADLAGLKIRFAGLGGQALQRLGAAVTMLPGGELFQALEKGAIDATEYSLPEVDARLGFDRVARFNYFPGWHQPYTAFHLVVNRGDWEALAPADRALVELACGDGVQRNFAAAEAAQGRVVAQFQADGITTATLSPELLAAIEGAVEEVLEVSAASDPLFARVLAHQRAFESDYARWQALAYPAPDASPAGASARPGENADGD